MNSIKLSNISFLWVRSLCIFYSIVSWTGPSPIDWLIPWIILTFLLFSTHFSPTSPHPSVLNPTISRDFALIDPLRHCQSSLKVGVQVQINCLNLKQVFCAIVFSLYKFTTSGKIMSFSFLDFVYSFKNCVKIKDAQYLHLPSKSVCSLPLYTCKFCHYKVVLILPESFTIQSNLYIFI